MNQRRLLVVSLCGLMLLAPTFAATIAGRVRDQSNTFLLGATVTLKELGREATTDRDGEFMLHGIPAGSYSLVVGYLGYPDATQTITVAGDAERRLDITLGSDVVQLGRFVVEGTREGQARALQQKRSAHNIMEAVSADAVGKFPDDNAAEALRRVPGISLEIDQGEGRFVVIRGVDAALNNVTLNGQMIGSPAEQGRRGLAMDSVPADLVSRLEVAKAVTPDMDHNAIGASVNIVTQSAFDRAETFLFGSASAGYSDFRERWGRRSASATAGHVFGPGRKWGVVLGASYSVRKFGSQTSDQIDWSQANGFFRPTTQEAFDYNIRRSRMGINAALEFRPRDGHQLYLRGNFNEFADDEARDKTGYSFALGTLTNQTASSGNYSQGRATKEFRDYKQTHTIDAVSLGGKHDGTNELQVEWQIGASSGERDTPRRVDWEFRSAAGAFPNRYDLSGDILRVTPNAAFYEPASYPFRRARFRTDLEREEIYSGQLDVRRAVQLGGWRGFWKAGAKFVHSDKTQDRQNVNYNLAAGATNAFTLAQAGLAGPEPQNFMEGRYRLGPTINLPALKAFFAGNPARFTYDAAGSFNNSISADFDATEKVTSGYGMVTLHPSANTTVVGGLRYERTDVNYGANELISRAGTFTGFNRITGSRTYDQLLPGLHFTWRPTKQVAVRGAWTNTYGRANYTDLAPRNSLDDVDLGGGVFEGSLSSGNPRLEPFESMNFDATAEYYLPTAGIVSIGAFHKRIDNPVYRRSVTLFNTTYNGRNYSRLGITAPANADRGEIRGVEFNYHQFFTFLPGAFSGLGASFNYTVIKSSATLFDRSDNLPFFKQSDEIGNIALLYEKYGFEARVALSFNSAYLTAVGASRDTDEYIDRRSPVDVKLSYRINRRLRVFAEFTNVNEEPLVEYSGVPGRVQSLEIYSWNANAGINWKY